MWARYSAGRWGDAHGPDTLPSRGLHDGGGSGYLDRWLGCSVRRDKNTNSSTRLSSMLRYSSKEEQKTPKMGAGREPD